MNDIVNTILVKLAEEIERVEGVEGSDVQTFTFITAKNLVIAELKNKAGVNDTSESFITLPTDEFDAFHDTLLLLCMAMLDDMVKSVTSKNADDDVVRILMVSASTSVLEFINQLKRC